MSQKQTPGPHWDKDQVAPDPDQDAPEDQGEVWNRHQMEIDRTEGGDRPSPRTPDDPATAGEPSGHGQPSGESHWERNDPGDR